MSRKLSGLDTREGREIWAGRVKELRVAQQMRQEDVAKLAQVSRTTLIAIEAGQLVPQAGTLQRILDVFGVSPEDAAAQFSDDVTSWLSIIGSLLSALPTDRRDRAGRAAVSVITAEITSAGAAADDDFDFETDPPKRGDLRLAAKRGKRK